MGGGTDRPPIWLLPRQLGSLPKLGAGHPWLALAIAATGLAALVPAFLFLAPASHWSHEAALVVLLLSSFYAFAGAAPLRATASLDASFVPAMLAVVLFGPLAGALVFAAPELTRVVDNRRPTATLANLASFGWAALAAAWTLDALGYESHHDLGSLGSYGAVAIAGLVLLLVNYFYTSIIIDRIGVGTGLWFMTRRELIATLPMDLPLLAAATATAFLYTEIGVAGLFPLAVIVFIPRLVLPRLLRAVPVWDLSISDATARYAGGLAYVLSLSSSQRRVLRDAATHLGGSASLTRLDDFDDVMRTVLYSHEPWGGGGGLGLMSGDGIPMESRVLAVAHAWATLTAQGGAGLAPRDALVNLRMRAGQELDPVVVAAAVKTVQDDVIDLGPAGARLPSEGLDAVGGDRQVA